MTLKRHVVVERVIMERVHVVMAGSPKDAKDVVAISRGEYMNDKGRPGGYVESARAQVIRTSKIRRRREWVSVTADDPEKVYEGEDPSEPKWTRILDDPREFGNEQRRKG